MRGDERFSTIPQLVLAAAVEHGDAPAIEDGDQRLSYAELAAAARRAGRLFVSRGVKPGDRVAIWAPNQAQWVVAALGIHFAGGCLVPINTRYKGTEARFILDKAGCRLVVTVDGFLGLDFASMLQGWAGELLVFGDSWDQALATAPEVALPDVTPHMLSDILFTSGTTGKPKGVMTTHAQSLRAYWDWSAVVGLREGDRYLVVAPFFHCFGYKAGWLACLLRGATIIPQPVFDVDAVLGRLATDRIGVLPGPPALYQSILMKDWRQHDLSSLRLAVTGAASIPVQLIRDMREQLGFETVITGYGLTEASGVATMCRFDDDPETIATTSGRAIPDVHVVVAGPDGAEVPRGEPGQVLVRGYNVTQGYWDEPEQTGQAIVDGWLHTGDVGVMDERGYLRITDRIKDMFIVGGFNAYPAEIEEALLEHPAVGQVAVVGVPDARLGEVGMAWVVKTGELDEAALVAWSRERMANFKVPRRVVFVDELPRNASGKVLKFELRERAGA